MKLETLAGMLIALTVFCVALFTSIKNIGVIFDIHAALIVIGGTVAVALICFPLKRIVALLKVFMRRMLGTNARDYASIVDEIAKLSEGYRRGHKVFEGIVSELKDPFLKDAAGVLSWLEADVAPEQLRDLLETRVETHYKLYMNEVKVFRIMGKFPPAFGLMGTTMGMIALLQSLGSEESRSMIGPSMAIALVATLYGLVLTNFVFIPIAENLSEQTEEDMIARSIVVEGIMLIQEGHPTKFVVEKVKSYLLPTQRLALDEKTA
ncbi:MAG: MotA/TolQ/ExbB proton channel family protein [Chitinophagaceae bacterium]|nr:MotA/TolQ/ExbB proton channel family protein [Oligoflexus sp.]